MSALMKIVCAALLVALFGLAWLFKNQIDINRLQAVLIQNLSATLADRTRQEGFELQQKCASQAERTYHQLGYREDQPTGDVLSAVYQSHYSTAHNQCFMTLELISKGGFQSKFLFDAYENRTYAEYDWMPKKDMKFDEVPP
jgi:hypothetical protein